MQKVFVNLFILRETNSYNLRETASFSSRYWFYDSQWNIIAYHYWAPAFLVLFGLEGFLHLRCKVKLKTGRWGTAFGGRFSRIWTFEKKNIVGAIALPINGYTNSSCITMSWYFDIAFPKKMILEFIFIFCIILFLCVKIYENKYSEDKILTTLLMETIKIV